MNAVSYGYAVKLDNDDGFSPGYFALSDYTNDTAGKYYDGNTATGYPGTSTITGDVSIGALIDLGATQTITAFSREITGTIGDAHLAVSSDGVTWVNKTFTAAAGPPAHKYNLPSGTTGRYFQFTAAISVNPPVTISITEFYIYDSTGTVVGPPSSPPPPAPRRRHLPHVY